MKGSLREADSAFPMNEDDYGWLWRASLCWLALAGGAAQRNPEGILRESCRSPLDLLDFQIESLRIFEGSLKAKQPLRILVGIRNHQ